MPGRRETACPNRYPAAPAGKKKKNLRREALSRVPLDQRASREIDYLMRWGGRRARLIAPVAKWVVDAMRHVAAHTRTHTCARNVYHVCVCVRETEEILKIESHHRRHLRARVRRSRLRNFREADDEARGRSIDPSPWRIVRRLCTIMAPYCHPRPLYRRNIAASAP